MLLNDFGRSLGWMQLFSVHPINRERLSTADSVVFLPSFTPLFRTYRWHRFYGADMIER